MSRNASADVRLPRVDDIHPDVATFMIARALAEIYRDAVEEPIPEPLAAILRQIQAEETRYGRHPA